ncbi:MAG: hypothetical protein ACI9VT_002500 [Psychroserpens sp.]|jgi:hypothetical protein
MVTSVRSKIIIGITIVKTVIVSTNPINIVKVEYNVVILKKATILNEIPTNSNVCNSDVDIVLVYGSGI